MLPIEISEQPEGTQAVPHSPIHDEVDSHLLLEPTLDIQGLLGCTDEAHYPPETCNHACLENRANVCYLNAL